MCSLPPAQLPQRVQTDKGVLRLIFLCCRMAVLVDAVQLIHLVAQQIVGELHVVGLVKHGSCEARRVHVDVPVSLAGATHGSAWIRLGRLSEDGVVGSD